MAYSTATPPRLLVETITGSIPSIWVYSNSDAQATVAGAAYITNALQLGMEVGDILFYSRTGTVTAFAYVVLSFTGNAANLSAGSTVGA